MSNQNEDEDLPSYEAELALDAQATYEGLYPSAQFNSLRKVLTLLSMFPGIGTTYDPQYEAAALPTDARVVYAGKYGIYYVIDEGVQKVFVLAIENQRSNPLTRFSKGPTL